VCGIVPAPGMAFALDAGGVFAVVVLVLLVGVLGVFAGRRWALARRWATFECSMRADPGGALRGWGRGWALGVGVYGDGVLRWYRLFSLRMRPCMTLDRRQVDLISRRLPAGNESRALIPGHVVVSVSHAERVLELAMKPEAVMSLTAWLETASRV
jgi:hypothetical protein